MVAYDDEKGIEESLAHRAYVVAWGSYSPLLLAPVGVSGTGVPGEGLFGYFAPRAW